MSIKKYRHLVFICGFDSKKNLQTAYRLKEKFDQENEKSIVISKDEITTSFTNFLLKDRECFIDSLEYLYLYQKEECRHFLSVIKHIAEHNSYAHIIVYGRLFHLMSNIDYTQSASKEFSLFGYKAEFYFLNKNISKGIVKNFDYEKRKYHRARKHFNRQIEDIRKNSMVMREI